MGAELNGQNQLLQSYAWGPDGRLLSITDYTGGAPTNYQVVTDGSGSVEELLDSSTGLIAASYQYDPSQSTVHDHKRPYMTGFEGIESSVCSNEFRHVLCRFHKQSGKTDRMA